MKTPNTRSILSQFGLEPRRSTTARATSVMSWLGLGAALGAGVVLATRLVPVRRLFQRVTTDAPATAESVNGAATSMPGKTAPVMSRPMHA